MKKYPQYPWVLFACILGVATGYLQSSLGAKNKLITMGDRYSDLSLKLLNFPLLDSAKLSSLFTSSQFYLDTLSFVIIILMDIMICVGMLNYFTPQKNASIPQNLLANSFLSMSTIITGSIGSSFALARSILNFSSGATNQLACVFNGVICILLGYSSLKLLYIMPMVFLEGILMGLELKVVRVPELIFTFKNDQKLFVTNMTVVFAMLFTKGTNAIMIGLFVYLVILAKELMLPSDELIFSVSKLDQPTDENQNLEHSSK